MKEFEKFWEIVDDIDRRYNPEAWHRSQQNRRDHRDDSATMIHTRERPVSADEIFTSRPRRGRETSPGWRAQVNALYRAGHISAQERDRRLGRDQD